MTINIEISRRWLAGVLSLVAVGALLAIGYAVSPRENGNPLLLSPRRLAIMRYVNKCKNWAHQLEILQSKLDALSAEVSSDTGVLYRRALEIQQIVDSINAIERDVERTPPILETVHSQVASTVQAFAAWANALLDIPSPQHSQEISRLGQAAKDSLAILKRMLLPGETNGQPD